MIQAAERERRIQSERAAALRAAHAAIHEADNAIKKAHARLVEEGAESGPALARVIESLNEAARATEQEQGRLNAKRNQELGGEFGSDYIAAEQQVDAVTNQSIADDMAANLTEAEEDEEHLDGADREAIALAAAGVFAQATDGADMVPEAPGSTDPYDLVRDGWRGENV